MFANGSVCEPLGRTFCVLRLDTRLSLQTGLFTKEKIMPENILERGFKNVHEGGKITGFELLIKSSYYRGIALSLIEDFEVTVDGESYGRDKIKFTTPDGAHTYTLDELQDVTTIRWPWQAPAKLTVSKPGGLKPGAHNVQVVQKDRISYMPSNPQVRTYRKNVVLVA